MGLSQDIADLEELLEAVTTYQWPPPPTAETAYMHLDSINRKLADLQDAVGPPDNAEIAKALGILNSISRRHGR